MKGDLEGVMLNGQSCVDHSILAIFEDSSTTSEVSRLNALILNTFTPLKDWQGQCIQSECHCIVMKELN